jgi:hypothetical protein
MGRKRPLSPHIHQWSLSGGKQNLIQTAIGVPLLLLSARNRSSRVRKTLFLPANTQIRLRRLTKHSSVLIAANVRNHDTCLPGPEIFFY